MLYSFKGPALGPLPTQTRPPVKKWGEVPSLASPVLVTDLESDGMPYFRVNPAPANKLVDECDGRSTKQELQAERMKRGQLEKELEDLHSQIALAEARHSW